MKTVICKEDYYLDMGKFTILLSKTNRMDYVDLAISENSVGSKIAYCAISGIQFAYDMALISTTDSAAEQDDAGNIVDHSSYRLNNSFNQKS